VFCTQIQFSRLINSRRLSGMSDMGKSMRKDLTFTDEMKFINLFFFFFYSIFHLRLHESSVPERVRGGWVVVKALE
jgi:hypothetical protein